MTARDAGGIACRTLSAYLGILAFRGIALTLSAIPLERLGVDSGNLLGTPFAVYAMQSGLYAVASAYLWVKSKSFWPSDEDLLPEPTMDANAWLRLSFIVLGTYFVLTAGPSALIMLFRSSLPSGVTSHMDLTRDSAEVVQTVLAILLILYGAIGWKKTAAPSDTVMQ